MSVPGLQIKLVYLGALNSKGCMCTIVCGVVKVAKGASVITKGKIVRNLYKLIRDATASGVVKETSSNRGMRLCSSGVRCDEIIRRRIDRVFKDII